MPRRIIVSGILAAIGLLFACCPFAAARSEPIPTGTARHTIEVAGTAFELLTYKPPRYADGALLVTLHGLNRNAAADLGYTQALADRHNFLLVAPRFDRERFPTWRYQRGGIARDAGSGAQGSLEIAPESSWTITLLVGIVEQVRKDEGRPDLPYYLLGHSAGAQLLGRVAAFSSTAAARIVIANPSTHVWPTRDVRFPYGFGGLPARLASDEAIRRYLAQPVTLLLGTADVRRDSSLNVSDGAMRQGANRYERGRNVFEAAGNIARERGWAFNWRLVEVPGAGHSARRMYASPQADIALLGE